MPLICVPRYVVSIPYIYRGTQYVGGELRFDGPEKTTIHLSEQVFSATGKYVLFEYNSFYTPLGMTELDVLNNYVDVDASELDLSTFGSWTVDTVNKRVIANLRSRPDNGCQFINNSELVIDGPLHVHLDSSLYATAGTYTLFDWSNGGSFSGSASNIILYPQGLGVGTHPYVDAVTSTIKFTLV